MRLTAIVSALFISVIGSNDIWEGAIGAVIHGIAIPQAEARMRAEVLYGSDNDPMDDHEPPAEINPPLPEDGNQPDAPPPPEPPDDDDE